MYGIGETRNHLPLHAVTACDKVSTVYRQGKLSIWCTKNRTIYLLDTFTDSGSTHDEVKRAGETSILKIYGASSFESLDDCRHIAYTRAIGHSSLSVSFQLQSLPPTSAAVKQYSYRTL